MPFGSKMVIWDGNSGIAAHWSDGLSNKLPPFEKLLTSDFLCINKSHELF
jgi:hypothetical protein